MADCNLKGHLAMLCANIFWGMMSPIVKLVLVSGIIAPIVIVDFRIAGAAVLFWVLSLFMPKEHVPIRDVLLMAGAAMIGVLFNQGCFIIGVSFTSPGEASLITTTMPMWVMILAWIILHEPITGKKVVGIILGATGAVILILGNLNASARGVHPVLGDFIVMMAQLSYALYLTLYRNFIRKYSLVTLMKWMFLSASIVGITCTSPWLAETSWKSISALEWGGMIYVMAIGTFLAYICIMIGQKTLRPTIVGMYNYVQPIVAMFVGVFIGFESITWLKLLAIALIFYGVYMVTISRSYSKE